MEDIHCGDCENFELNVFEEDSGVCSDEMGSRVEVDKKAEPCSEFIPRYNNKRETLKNYCLTVFTFFVVLMHNRFGWDTVTILTMSIVFGAVFMATGYVAILWRKNESSAC